MATRRKPLIGIKKFDVGSSTMRMAILSVLEINPMCGYHLVRELKAHDPALITYFGVLYPMLERYERLGLVKGRWEKGKGRRMLHVYHITPAGSASLRRSIATWRRLCGNLRKLFGDLRQDS